MKITILPEPELEFGNGGRHEDIRFGIMDHGLLQEDSRKKEIRVGIVGTDESIEGTKHWIKRCTREVPAKKSSHPNLFPPFPGFSADSCFQTECVVPDRAMGQISEKALLDSFAKGGKTGIAEVVDHFAAALERIDEKESIDVAVCAVPLSVLGTSDEAPPVPPGETPLNFRGLLKARSMPRRFPVQLLLPVTYGGGGKRSLVGAKPGTYQQGSTQDEATRAWNFFVALIYKAGIAPWRLVRESRDYESCYVGVSFYRALDSAGIMTSMAQVFNERGEGMVLRGGPVELTKDDPQPHLTELDAKELLAYALSKYKAEHRHLPARVVVHKTSQFNAAELAGFSAAANEHDVDLFDFLSVARGGIRLFRHGEYPPLRGTCLQLDMEDILLYTRGSCEFYETYTGLYVPRALYLKLATHETAAEKLAGEILALTKLNWNSTQIDGSFPITTRAARRVGDVLKYIPEDEDPKAQYSFYM